MCVLNSLLTLHVKAMEFISSARQKKTGFRWPCVVHMEASKILVELDDSARMAFPEYVPFSSSQCHHCNFS